MTNPQVHKKMPCEICRESVSLCPGCNKIWTGVFAEQFTHSKLPVSKLFNKWRVTLLSVLVHFLLFEWYYSSMFQNNYMPNVISLHRFYLFFFLSRKFSSNKKTHDPEVYIILYCVRCERWTLYVMCILKHMMMWNTYWGVLLDGIWNFYGYSNMLLKNIMG